MASSATKKVLIAALLLLLLALLGAGIYVYRASRPLAAPVAGQAPDVFSLLPGDAPVVAYLDAKALRTTQNSTLAALGQFVLPTPQQDPDYTEFVRKTGFDYSRDLDRAAIALWPAGLGAAAGSSDQNRTLAIADGRFDQQRIKAYALRTGHTVAHASQIIYEVPGNPPVSFAFLSATRVAMASGPDATSLLTASPSGTRDPEMQSRINRVAGAPLFAVARTDHLPQSFYDGFKNSPQLESLVRSIVAITLAGQPQGDNLALTLDGECDSMTSATKLTIVLDGLRLMGSAAIKDARQHGQMTAEQAVLLSTLLNQVKLSPQENWVRLTFDLTPKMLASKKGT